MTRLSARPTDNKETKTAPAINLAEVQAKFATTRDEFNEALIERQQEVDYALTSLLSQESLLLVGFHGTAKSLLLDGLVGWLHGTKFNYLLNKFTDPAEVLGPFSMQELRSNDKYIRVTDGYLPTADVVFLDEVFNSSSALLNTLNKALNERTIRNGTHDVHIPMRLFVGACNKVPNADEIKDLGALFDRFLLRSFVRPQISKAGRHRLLALTVTGQPWVERDHTPKLSTSLSLSELDAASHAAAHLTWSKDAEEALETILDEIERAGIILSPRRQFKSVGIAQSFAWLDGANEVAPEHLEILQSVLWDDPQDQPAKVSEIVVRIANPAGSKVNGFLQEMHEILTKSDLRDLAKAAEATKKLGEISKQLSQLDGPKAAKALDEVKAEIKRIRLSAINGLS